MLLLSFPVQVTSRYHDRVIRSFFTDSTQAELTRRSEATLYINSPDVVEIKEGNVSQTIWNDVSSLLRGVPKRLHICKLRVASEHDVLWICWHGPQTERTFNNFRPINCLVRRASQPILQAKKFLLKRLLRVVHKLTDVLDCDGGFILAGDFNLRYSEAATVINDEQMIGLSSINGVEAVDYMITWPKKLFMLRGNVQSERWFRFNHQSVFITLTLNREYSDILEDIRSLWL